MLGIHSVPASVCAIRHKLLLVLVPWFLLFLLVCNRYLFFNGRITLLLCYHEVLEVCQYFFWQYLTKTSDLYPSPCHLHSFLVHVWLVLLHISYFSKINVWFLENKCPLIIGAYKMSLAADWWLWYLAVGIQISLASLSVALFRPVDQLHWYMEMLNMTTDYPLFMNRTCSETAIIE